jgi:hypothetical protein
MSLHPPRLRPVPAEHGDGARLVWRRGGELAVRQAVWYRKPQPTFADAIAVVRQHLWTSTHVYMSPAKADMVEIPCAPLNRLTDTLCYAA